VEVGAQGPDERFQDVGHVLRRQLADPLAHEREVEYRIGPTREVDRDAGKGIVHGHAGVTEAGDARPVTQRAREGVAEDERHVLDGVVLVDVQVARGPDPQSMSE